MSGIRAVAVMALSLTALRVLPAQDPGVRATTVAESRQYRESIASFERALQLHTGSPGQHAWNIARAYAHLGNRKQALRWLTHALELGFSSRALIENDAAFDQYRDDARYQYIIAHTGKPIEHTPLRSGLIAE